jgi:prepilin-type processing-associated H-X9-DG protein
MFAQLLPFVEQQQTFNAINFDFGANDMQGTSVHHGHTNRTGLTTRISTYVCPSDSEAITLALPSNPYSQSSYVSSSGLDDVTRYLACPRGINATGAFSRNRAFRMNEFRDGLSNTFMVGEFARFDNHPHTYTNSWTRFLWIIAGAAEYPGTTYTQTIASAVPRLNSKLRIPDPPHVAAPAGNSLTWVTEPQALEAGQYGFRSVHPGGANFLFGDGSVKFIKETINIDTYRALSTKARGEVISSDQY